MEFIELPHSIYSKDENGRILAEIRFPEIFPGEFNIESTYVAEEYIGSDVPGELVEKAESSIRAQGGKIVRADCPFAHKYLKERHIIN